MLILLDLGDIGNPGGFSFLSSFQPVPFLLYISLNFSGEIRLVIPTERALVSLLKLVFQ